MDRLTALNFCYPKAAGLLSKSFVKSRAALLFEQKSLGDLWALLFKTPVPLVPETVLAQQIEAEAFRTFVRQYGFFLSQFDSPDEILVSQLKVYDVENLKEITDALCSGEGSLPRLMELGGYEILHTEFWPDLKKITDKTEFSWYSSVPDVHSQHKAEFQLDLYLVRNIWASIQRTRGEERQLLEQLFLDEFVIKNVIWALRLSVYYQLSRDEVVSRLFYVTDKPTMKDPVCAEALKVLNFRTDDFSDWRGWRFSEHLNPAQGGRGWHVEPSWIEQSCRRTLMDNAFRLFHNHGMTLAAMVAWFKIKDFELDCIRTAVESLRLKIPAAEAMSAVGAGQKRAE